ncbi:MAG: MotA/TolQ/ExbB proton channel family protein [Polyangiales bacterium]
MDIVTKSKSLMLTVGAAPVMYLMLGLSAGSLAVILERAWVYRAASDDLESLAKDLDRCLADGDLDGAKKRLSSSRSIEAKVVLAGLEHAHHGPEAAAQAIYGATALHKTRLEERLAFLGTLGNNAPFIGLFGTVIGIVQAFDKLGGSSAGAGTEVMGSIAEALVATAIGLLVAIPAVAAFNWFQRRIKTIGARTEALGRVLLAHLEAKKHALVA